MSRDFKVTFYMGRNPGLVVMGGDSCFEGRGFESLHRILDGHFVLITLIQIGRHRLKTNKNICCECKDKELSLSRFFSPFI